MEGSDGRAEIINFHNGLYSSCSLGVSDYRIIIERALNRTVINDNSINYGFESQRKSYNGVEYDMVVMNDKGKKYLLNNIEETFFIQ